MDIKTKYNLGDRVLVSADLILRQTCPFCEGKGFRTLQGTDFKFYCQNCKDGQLVTRTSNNRQLVEGIITKVVVETKKVDCEDDEWWYNAEEGQIGQHVEYAVDIVDSENFYGNGMYDEDKIKEVTSHEVSGGN